MWGWKHRQKNENLMHVNLWRSDITGTSGWRDWSVIRSPASLKHRFGVCYLCRRIVPALLYRTVWICRTAWPRRHRGCGEGGSGPGWREGWSATERDNQWHHVIIVIDCWTYWSAERYLAPHQHGAKDDLQAVKEVVTDQNDGGSACRPALAGTDGFNTGSGCWTRDTETQRHRERERER